MLKLASLKAAFVAFALILSYQASAQSDVCNGTNAPDCRPAFNPSLSGGDYCSSNQVCFFFGAEFTFNPPQTVYEIDWNDGTVEMFTHQQLLNLPVDAISRRQVCHAYLASECVADTLQNYAISILITNPTNGKTNSAITGEIFVLDPVIADFNAPTDVCINQPFTIENLSDQGFDENCMEDARYEWDLNGDGNVDQVTTGLGSISHTYGSPGVKTIRLEAFYPNHPCPRSVVEKTVNVLNIPRPSFDIGTGTELQSVSDCNASNVFVFNPASNACASVSLPLVNTTTNRNPTTTFLWSVSPTGGASFQNSNLTLDNNVINFGQAGIYEVRLTVSDQCADGLSGQNFACIRVIVKDVPQLAIDLNSGLCEGDQLIGNIRQNNTGNLDPADVTNINWSVVKTSAGGAGVPAFTNGNDNLTINNMPAGTYNVSLVYQTICGTATAGPENIEVFPIPTVTVTSNPSSVCPDEPFTVSANNTTADSYTWFENGTEIVGETGTSINRQITVPGTYQYSVDIIENGCPGSSNVATVTVNSAASADDILVSQGFFCSDETISFTLQAQNVSPASSALQWQQCTVCNGSDWTDIAGANASTFNGSATGTFRLRVSNAGCPFFTPEVTVSQAVATGPSITSPTTSTCGDAGGILISSNFTNAPASPAFQWRRNGANIAGANGATFTATQSGSYSLVVTANGCPETSNTLDLTITPLDEVQVMANDQEFCNFETVNFTLTANGVESGTVLQWQTCTTCNGSDWTDVSGETGATFNGSSTGTYRIQTDVSGCIFNSDPIEITQRDAINPIITLAGGGSVCAGDDATLTANTSISSGSVALSYQWQRDGLNIAGATSSTYMADAAGDYRVVVMQDGVCTETSAPVTVSVDPLPDINFSVSQNAYCSGDQMNVTFSSATPNLTFGWRALPNGNVSIPSTAGTGNVQQIIQNNSNTIQSLTIRAAALNNATNCQSDSIDIVIPVAPDISLNLPTNLEICDGEFFSANINTSVTEEITYQITVLNTEAGIAGAQPIDETNQTGSFTLSQRLTNSSSVAANATYNIKGILTHNGVTCESPNYTLTVRVKPTPNLIFDTASADTLICSGETLNLNLSTDPVGAGISYTFIDNPNVEGEMNGTGNTISQPLTSVNDSTSEFVTYQISISADGCDGVARNIVAVVNPIPTITLASTQNDTIICGPGNFQSTIVAQSTVRNSTFRWLDSSNQPVSNSETLVTNVIGTYTAEITTPDNCSTTRQVEIVRRELALPVIDTLSISTTNPVACPGDTVLLSASASGAQAITNYQWFFNNQPIAGATASTFPAVTSGEYSVRVNEGSPCPEFTTPVTVAFPPEPDPAIGGLISSLCPEEGSLALQAINNEPLANITGYAWVVSPTSFASFDNPTGSATNLLVSDNKTGGDVSLTLTLTLTTVDGCQKSITESLLLTSRPIANFQAPAELCETDVLVAEDRSQFADSLRWSVSPDAGVQIDNATADNPNITFSPNNQRSATQTYSIRQIAYRGGCADTLRRDVVVFPAPAASFTKNFMPVNGCGPVVADFTSTSTGVNLQYNWDFGNGRTATGIGPFTETFEPDTVSRTYVITLETVSDICQNSIFRDTIFVRPVPKVSRVLFGHPIPVCADFPLPINYVVVGQPDSVLFDFGDGSSRVETDSAGIFTHTYRNETEGDSTFTLTVIAVSECASDTLTRPVVVSPNEVTAFYEADTATTCQFTAVRFTSNQFASSGNQIIWDWGDGNITNDSISVSHVYETAGTFFPKLIVKNGCNVDTCSLQSNPPCGAAINVLGAPTAAFSVEEKACDGSPVTFINQSTEPTISRWDFGNGSGSDDRNPEPYLFASAGDYNVILEVIDENNCRDTTDLNLTVHPLPQPRIVPPEGPFCERDSLIFANDSDGALSHLWKVETLNLQSTGESAAIPFPTEGLYEVSLTAFDEPGQMGCSDSTNFTLAVGEVPVPDFELVEVGIDCGVTGITIVNNSTISSPDNAFWVWDFGNGNSGDAFFNSTTEQYANFDDFEKEVTISLTINHVNGCSSSLQKTFTLPAFREDVVLPPNGEMICFTPGKAPNESFRLLFDNVEETGFEMAIFNEFGAQVFRSDNINDAWDGFYNGRIASVGVYVAQVAFRGCNSQKTKQKNISICVRN
ncbi:MAG: PKD domain-containing protein [Bacteroidota bacterium]